MSSESARKGSYGTNGHGAHHVDSSSSTIVDASPTTAKTVLPEKQKPEALPKPTRVGISSTLTKYGQILHALRRPGQAQAGNASYGPENDRPKLKMDLRSIRGKGKYRMFASHGYD
jgi:hypothetical protein